jgi:hypothetical protein
MNPINGRKKRKKLEASLNFLARDTGCQNSNGTATKNGEFEE